MATEAEARPPRAIRPTRPQPTCTSCPVTCRMLWFSTARSGSGTDQGRAGGSGDQGSPSWIPSLASGLSVAVLVLVVASLVFWSAITLWLLTRGRLRPSQGGASGRWRSASTAGPASSSAAPSRCARPRCSGRSSTGARCWRPHQPGGLRRLRWRRKRRRRGGGPPAAVTRPPTVPPPVSGRFSQPTGRRPSRRPGAHRRWRRARLCAPPARCRRRSGVRSGGPPRSTRRSQGRLAPRPSSPRRPRP